MFAVIMAGGSGTRFWPASRRKHPKQLLDLWGEPMIQKTVKNLEVTVPAADQLVVTGRHLVDGILAAAPGLKPEHVIAEPVGRNTAPVVGLAAALLEKDHGDVVFGVFPADHMIGDEDAWAACLAAAEEAAAAGPIVTLGVRPSRPETGYGYIEYVDAGESGLEARRVKRFVEKPDRATAEAYLDAGNFLWNAGIFVSRTSTMLAEIKRQMPKLHAGLQKLAAAWRTPEWGDTLASVFPTLPSTSIDYGVMEGAEEIRVVPASFQWNDVGHWAALDETMEHDDAGNVVVGDVMTLDAENNVLVSQTEQLVVALGVEDLVVVQTGDALLIARKDRVQDVKRVVQKLAEADRDSLL